LGSLRELSSANRSARVKNNQVILVFPDQKNKQAKNMMNSNEILSFFILDRLF